MGDSFAKFRAAAVQAAPVFLDRDATVEKACNLIREAGKKGAELIVFPETFIPAYPYWPKEYPSRGAGYKAFVQLYQNSMEIPGRETEVLCQAASKAGAYVAMGLNERDGGTLYNTTLYIDPEAGILGKHRKLVPTHGERAIWGMGDGSDLRVFETRLGRLGGLICGEHFMTLSRFALFAKREQIHTSTWPGKRGIIPTIDTMSKSYALEGQVFVVVASMYLTPDLVPDDFGLKEYTDWDTRGGSCIIDPRGYYLAEPLYDQEGIVYADIDLEMIVWAKAMVDVVGHYARPDVATMLLNERHLTPCRTLEGGPWPEGGAAYAEIAASLEEISRKVGQAPEKELKDDLERLRRRLQGARSP